MDQPRLVLVEWEDAKVVDDAVWAENKPAEYLPHIVQQVGFLVYDGPEGIHLTQAWHPRFVAARDQIPRAMIRSITPLAVAPRGRRK
jgi:hypothetical protein